jgi:type II restriction enzyme
MQVTKGNHPVSKAIFDKLLIELPTLSGGTQFKLGGILLEIEGKDGLGGLIEEWFGVWAKSYGFSIYNPKFVDGTSQEFPDYYVGNSKDGYLEIKTFDADTSPNFDIANFESYCESLSTKPHRLFSDYLIFSYRLDGASLSIDRVWLKKIWEITCASKAYPLKTQNKRGVIYNIRPATFHSSRTRPSRFPVFSGPTQFIDALYQTQFQYNHKAVDRALFEINLTAAGINLNNL